MFQSNQGIDQTDSNPYPRRFVGDVASSPAVGWLIRKLPGHHDELHFLL